MLHTVTERGDQPGAGASQLRCVSGGTRAVAGKTRRAKATVAGARRAAPRQRPPRGDHAQRRQSHEGQTAGTTRKNNKGE